MWHCNQLKPGYWMRLMQPFLIVVFIYITRSNLHTVIAAISGLFLNGTFPLGFLVLFRVVKSMSQIEQLMYMLYCCQRLYRLLFHWADV